MSPSRYRRFFLALFCSLVGASLSALDTAAPPTKGVDVEQKRVRDRTRSDEPGPVTIGYAPVVVSVKPDAAASHGGLAEGDVIFQVNRQAVKDAAAAEAAVARAGGRRVLKIFRDG